MRFKDFFLLQEQATAKTFYHVCKDSDLSYILKQGILAQQGNNTEQTNEPPRVLLFKSLAHVKEAVNNWLRENFAEDDLLHLLSVTLPDNFPLVTDPQMLEIISRADIPPSFIKLIQKNI